MFINITLVILLLIVFSYLNGKINNLENEIRALKKRNLTKEENIDSKVVNSVINKLTVKHKSTRGRDKRKDTIIDLSKNIFKYIIVILI